MNANGKAPILIVGQGLAGTLLAWQLLQRGQRVLVIDREESVTSSKVAGGIITPITGKRLVKTWRLDEFYPIAKKFYRWVEDQTGSQVYFEKPIQRLFKNPVEQAEFDQRIHEPGFARYVLQRGVPDKQGLLADKGGFVMPGGFLDVNHFLQVSRTYFSQLKCYQSGKVIADSIKILPEDIHWQGRQFRQIIFCQGWTQKTNPYFDWVPFKPAKGEVLEIECPELSQQRIINRGGFIAPLGNDKFRSGSTYEWQQLDNQSSEAGRLQICAKIRAMTDLPFKITSHKAAVRPVIEDCKALLGLHPGKERLGYFNGLGSKGVLNGPFLSAMLADHLVDGSPIEECVDVRKNI